MANEQNNPNQGSRQNQQGNQDGGQEGQNLEARPGRPAGWLVIRTTTSAELAPSYKAVWRASYPTAPVEIRPSALPVLGLFFAR